MNKTKEKGKAHTSAQRTSPRPRKRMEKKVSHQPVQKKGEGRVMESPWITARYAEGNSNDDQSQIALAVEFDRQVELEYADEDPDRIRIATSK